MASASHTANSEATDVANSIETLLEQLLEFSPRPAQDKLNQDQREALKEWNDGVRSRRAFLELLHRINWLTLGRLHGNFYARVARDDVVLSVMITEESNRRRYRDSPVAPDRAATARRRLAKKALRPALRAGYRSLRKEAGEYVEEGNAVDLEAVSMFAMRPSMDRYRHRQRGLLRSFLNGFDSPEEIDAWIHSLDDLTLGEIDRIDADLEWKFEMQRTAKQILLADSDQARRQRERLAAYYLLPAYSLVPQILLERAQEAREESSESNLREFDMT